MLQKRTNQQWEIVCHLFSRCVNRFSRCSDCSYNMASLTYAYHVDNQRFYQFHHWVKDQGWLFVVVVVVVVVSWWKLQYKSATLTWQLWRNVIFSSENADSFTLFLIHLFFNIETIFYSFTPFFLFDRPDTNFVIKPFSALCENKLTHFSIGLLVSQDWDTLRR